MPHSTAQMDLYRLVSRFIASRLAVPRTSHSSLSLYDDRARKGHFGLAHPQKHNAPTRVIVIDGRKKERRQGENNGGNRGAMADFASLCLRDSAEDGFHSHALAEVRLDKARLDATVGPHHERRRDRQQPAAVPLKLREIDAELQISVLDLFADPEHEAERKGIGQIEVGEHFEGKISNLFQCLGVRRRFRHDRNDVAARGGDGAMGAGERPQFEPAIVAPGTAVEAEDKRSLRQQRIEIDEVSLGVGEEEAGSLAPTAGTRFAAALGRMRSTSPS
jgi:hypothetical protein